LNNSLLQVIISSKNDLVFIHELSDLKLQIVSETYLASINEGSKLCIAKSNSSHALLWRFCLHCRIDVTGSPGMICIVCHQDRRHPLEYGTSSMGNHLLAKANIAKLNQLTETDVTELTSMTADETALAIVKRQGSRGITIVSIQRKIRLHIQFNPY
jgi:hypothetical protein